MVCNCKVFSFQTAFLIATFAFSFANPIWAQTYENYALTGTATQINVRSGGVASRAIDGDTNGVFADGSVQLTRRRTEGNWWQVDLGQVRTIDVIRLWNRTDCCRGRATNFHVFVSDVPFTNSDASTAGIAATQAQSGVSDYHITDRMGRPTEITVNRTGRYVRVQLVLKKHLNMAEVEVLGDFNDPKLSIEKTSDKTDPVSVGDEITYTYVVTNTGNVALTNINLTEDHRGHGDAPVPLNETLSLDSGVATGDSSDTTPNDGVWTSLGPGDKITYTSTYTVVSDDIWLLQ